MKITKEIKVAVLVILSIVLFYWGFAFLKGKNLFDTSTKLYAVYDNVAGLVVSAPVTINGFNIGKVNVDDNPQLSMNYGITSIPAILFVKGGQVVDKQIGAVPKAVLDKKIQSHM